MQLDKVLDEMKIKCFPVGNQEFDTLGLIQSDITKKICTFIDDEKYTKSISKRISLIITNNNISEKLGKYNLCIVDDPRNTFFDLHNHLCTKNDYLRSPSKSEIAEGCEISEKAYIASNNVIIGKNTVIEEFVSIKENVKIGENVIIRAGTVIGGQGFEFKKNDKKIKQVNHVGGVIIGNNAEIKYNSCVDKAIYPWDNTIISEYVKIDNLVHVAHSAKIGAGTMIVANSGLGGRVEIGHDSWVGFGCTLRNGIIVGDNARINMGAVVTKDVENHQSVSGNFAIEHSKFIENLKKNR